MKINDGFILQNVADEHIVVPIGAKASELHGVIRLNEAGALLWDALTHSDVSRKSLATALIEEFGIDDETADSDVNPFVKQLTDLGCLD